MTEITNEIFKNKFLNDNTKESCIIKFYARWCGPCRMMIPTFNKLEETYNSIDFYQVDIDNAEDLVEKFTITSVPSFIIVQKNADGSYNTETVLGLKSFDDVNTIIKETLDK